LNNNHRYSQRAFAKDLGLSKSYLHDLLNSDRQASDKMVHKIAAILNLSAEEKQQMLKPAFSGYDVREVDHSAMYHWQHFAILNFIETKPSTIDLKSMASSLRTDVATVSSALKDLIELKLIEKKDSGFERIHKSVKTEMDVPSYAIKCFHSENLHRAERALFDLDVESRECTSVTFAINKADYAKIKRETERFRKKIGKIVESSVEPDTVYTAAIQVFPQTQQKTKDDHLKKETV